MIWSRISGFGSQSVKESNDETTKKVKALFVPPAGACAPVGYVSSAYSLYCL
jgi:hypothetical protein